MPTLSPQLLHLFTRVYLLSKIAILCLLLATARYLLMLFSELTARTRRQQEGGKENTDERVNDLRSIYHALMAWLYFLFLFCAAALPLQLLAQFAVKLALLLACLLLCLIGEILPRVVLHAHHTPQSLTRWTWLIAFSKFVDKIIPLNGLLRQLFSREGQGHKASLTKENVHRLLIHAGETYSQRPIRQEQLQLLQKLRQLQVVKVGEVMVARKNIFLLDLEARLTAKLLNHLGRYCFSKILVFTGNEDNIIGYLQFKQLLAFELDQRISQHPLTVCRNLVEVREDDTLSTAIEMMIATKVNFAIVRGHNKREFVGLVRLKDIFSRLLLKWYNYGGLTADRTFHSISSLSLGKDRGGALQEAEEQN